MRSSLTPLDQLVARAKDGDESAFGEIYELWVERVFRFIVFKVKDREIAKDISSEIFLKCWRKLKSFKGGDEAAFSRWLFAIVRNSIIDYYRAKREAVSLGDLPELEDWSKGTDEIENVKLLAALEGLPKNYQEVLKLRFIDELSFSRMAQVLKKKEANVRQLVSRALNALRKQLS